MSKVGLLFFMRVEQKHSWKKLSSNLKVHDTSIWTVIAFDSVRLYVAIEEICFSRLEKPVLLVFLEFVVKLETEEDVTARELFVLDTISFNILLIA